MDKKKIAITIVVLAVLLFAVMLFMQKDVLGPEDTMSDSVDPRTAPMDVEPGLGGDTTDELENELEGIDVQELDTEFESMNDDLENL